MGCSPASGAGFRSWERAASGVLAALQGRGVKASSRTRGQSRAIFLTDPDNISVQLTDASYCGDSGPLGNECK